MIIIQDPIRKTKIKQQEQKKVFTNIYSSVHLIKNILDDANL